MAASDYYVTADGLNLPSRTADPITPAEGTFWHRSDINEIRYFVNGIISTVGASGVITNQVVVNTKSDFPTPVGGKITLAANTKYLIAAATINLGTDYLDIPLDCAIQGITGIVSQLIYSGAGGAIRVTDASFTLSHVTVVATVGQVFDCSNIAQDKIFIVQNVVYANCVSLGLITGFEIVNIHFCKYQNNTTGISFTSVDHLIHIDNFWGSSNTGTFVTLNNGTYDAIIISRNYMDAPLGATSLDINAMATVSSGYIGGNVFGGAGTVLTGITHDEIGWVIAGNKNLENSTASGGYYMNGNVTATVLAVQNQWVKIAGVTTVLSGIERFTHIASNRIRFDDTNPIKAQVSVSMAGTSVNKNPCEICIYKNGVLVVGTVFGNKFKDVELVYVGTAGVLNLVQNDYIEIWIRDTDPAPSNFTATNLTVTIHEI